MYPTLAGDRDAAFGAPKQLFAGDSEQISNSAVAAANIAQWQLCVLTPTGIKPYVVADDAALVPDKFAIAHVAVTTGQDCPYYSAGSFNHEVIGFPASVDTYTKRRQLVQGSMIQMNHLVG